jgi:hypothetical protein
MDFEESRDSETEEPEVPEVPKKRGRPTGAKNKPKEAPPPPIPPDLYSALHERIANLEASAKKIVMKSHSIKKEPKVSSPTNTARQLCEILRRDGIFPPAPAARPRDTQRQMREALYASFLS